MSKQFVRNTWYVAGDAAEITREPTGRLILNEPIVLYRREDGTPVALEDTCCHRRAPLHKGTVEGDNIRCPYHGMLFDSTGAAIWAQGQDRLPASMRVRHYPVVERDTWVWIWMGDPALADESKILDCSLCLKDGWAMHKGKMHIKAEVMLAIDNLMDLSHTAFVHKATVGSKEDLDPKLAWEQGENWVKGVRVARGLTPSAGYVARGAKDYKLDQTKVMTFTAPYNCNIDIYTTEAGCKLGEGRFNEQFMTYNMMTPETDDTFFFYWANCRNFKVGDKQFEEINRKVGVSLLSEDQWILEAVHQATSLNPSRPEIDLAADAGGLQARRIVKRLLDGELKQRPAAAVR